VRAIVATAPGGPEVLRIAEVPTPIPSDIEVLIEVRAAGVNRADLLQRQGLYPPPPGASDIIGMEVSGVVRAAGELVSDVAVGDAVVALIPGGGYAEFVVADSRLVLPMPSGLTFEQAAGVPEAFATVWSNVFMVAGLQPEEWIVIHGGGSGIGTTAIQLAHQAGAHVLTTVGSERKATACAGLGADVVVNYRETDFVDIVREHTGGQGADVILDILGAAYLNRNLAALSADGRLVIIGLQGGAKTEIDLGRLLARRLSVMGTTLRSRSNNDKQAILEQMHEVLWPVIENRSVGPLIDSVYELADAADAHAALAAGEPIGKVILRVSD
jgi:putative PIG3 family NAD(P)H quinone oxidoreductase